MDTILAMDLGKYKSVFCKKWNRELIQQALHIPAHLIPKLSRSFGVGKKARSFSPWSHIVSMSHVQIAHNLSVNNVANTLRNHSGILTTICSATPPSRNGLSRANRVRDLNMARVFFRAFFYYGQDAASSSFTGRTGVFGLIRFRCTFFLPCIPLAAGCVRGSCRGNQLDMGRRLLQFRPAG